MSKHSNLPRKPTLAPPAERAVTPGDKQAAAVLHVAS